MPEAPLPTGASTLETWMTALAAPTATPAGGAAAAIAGALAAALVQMVAGLTGGRERYASVHREAAGVRQRAAALRGEMVALAARDAEAFAGFARALRMPAATEEERAVRERARTEALHAGTEVQLELLARLGECAELAEAMAERGLASALGDATTAVFLAGAAARSAGWAVRSNLRETADRAAVERTLATASGLVARVEAVERRVRALLERRLA